MQVSLNSHCCIRGGGGGVKDFINRNDQIVVFIIPDKSLQFCVLSCSSNLIISPLLLSVK